jgi:anti-anti-sigma regulatory factor
MIEALQSSMRNKMKFVLVGVGPKVRVAFEITKLVGMFTICDTVEDAAK